jgi:hypothetical protein
MIALFYLLDEMETMTTTFVSFTLVFLTIMSMTGGGGCNGGGSFSVVNAFSFTPHPSVSTMNIVVSPLVRHSPKTISISTAIVRRRQATIISHAFTNNDNDYTPTELGSVIQPYYTKLMEQLPSSSVLSAIETYNGAPIVASDLASTAGISLTTARKELTKLVTLTKGDIAVNTNGELIYTFPPNISSVIASTSTKYRSIQLWQEKVYPSLLYATKLGFGLVLFASLIAIFSTIFFILSSGGGSSSDRDDDRRGRREGGFGGGMPMGMGGFWGPSPFDFFYYRPYYSRYYVVGGGRARQQQRNSDELGFLESVFSYVFGDGNPNGDVESRRISLAAAMIREYGGAVTAEQLAPFCNDAPMPLLSTALVANNGGGSSKLGEERAYVDESFVLPIVTQLDGEPRVTDEGDIVYVFPELMTSASSSSTNMKSSSTSSSSKEMLQKSREARILRRAGLDEDAPTSMIGKLLNMNRISTRGALERTDLINILETALPEDENENDVNSSVDDDPSLLVEREFKFSLASSFQTVLAGGLGVVNLGGALYLGNLLGQYAIYGVRLPSYMGLVQQFFPLLLGYAVLFNTIPLARSFWIRGQNEKIRKRNETRRSWRTVLEARTGSVTRKLLAAARFGKKMRQIGTGGDNDIVFDTKKGIDEVTKVKERDAMKDFDKVLDGKKDSSWE